MAAVDAEFVSVERSGRVAMYLLSVVCATLKSIYISSMVGRRSIEEVSFTERSP